nr:reverse transcriptase domain-containing protein [Tanacetum cinerariifolium]
DLLKAVCTGFISRTYEGTIDCVSGAKSDLNFRMKTTLTSDVRRPAHTRTTRETRCFTGTVLDHPLILTPEFGPRVIHGMRLTQRPEEKHDEEPKDLRKPYKEVLKSPFSRRIIEFSALNHQTPTNLKIYDGSTDPDDHITRFVGAANQGEWEMPVWCRMFQQTLGGPTRGWFDRLPNGCIDNWTNMREAFVERFALRRKCCKDPTKVSKIIRMDNETLLDFKERWTEEMSYIPDVPIDMQISSFMSNSKCPELARSFSDQVSKTVTKMMKRIDDFVKSEEVIKNTKFSKGEYSEKVTATQFRGSRSPRHSYGNGPPRMDVHHRRDHYQTYRTSATTPSLALNGGTTEKENLDRKLNHLIKDVRKRGNNRGRPTRNNNGRGKVINMVHKNRKDLKRKSPYKQHEEWMSVPITFPPVMADDVSDGPLIVEAEVEGYWIESEVQFRRGWLTRKVMMKFTVVRASSPYNVMLERTGLQELRAISSTVHAMLKFLIPKGIATLYARIEPVYECWWSERKTTKQEATKEKAEEHKAPVPEKEEKILVNPAFPEQAITISTQFSTKCREQLIRLLKDNMDVFVWKSSDMAGVSRRLIRHALNVNNSVPLVAHKRRILRTEKSKVVTREVEEWVKVGIVRPVKYPTWISNPVLVKKVDGTWRMCTDFKNLNAACPKDYYPLPEIDLKVEAVMGHPFKCRQGPGTGRLYQRSPDRNEATRDAQEVSPIVEEEEDNWMTPIIKCLEEGVWPKDKNKAKALRMKISQYVMEDGVLFKKSYLSPMLRCVGPLQANYIIRKVHEGACGMHTGARSVVSKIMRQGYYWPTMHGDTKEVVEKCDSCRIHAPVPKLPKTCLTSVMSPWPFYQWGLDILGPLPEGPRKLNFIIVAIDYFTKWMEAKPLAKTTCKEAKNFVWQNIMCRFGLPRVIITDNGARLVNDPFKSWCEK